MPPGPIPGTGALQSRDMSAQRDRAVPQDDTPPIGYAQAMAEIEAILRELESSSVDVDHLAERVQRASVLITLCRDRIVHARMQVDQVVAQLDTRH